MIGAFVLDPFTHLLDYRRSDGSECFHMRKPPPVDLFESRLSRFSVIEHVTIRRYDFALGVGGALVMDAEDRDLLREALSRGKVDFKTGDVRVRIAIYATSKEAAESVTRYAAGAIQEVTLYTTAETYRRTKRERRRLARHGVKRRMGCRRISKTYVETTLRVNLRTLLAIHDGAYVEAMRHGLPVRVDPARVETLTP